MTVFTGRLLCKNPLIYYSVQIESPRSFCREIGPAIADRNAIVLCLLAWCAESDYAAKKCVAMAREYHEKAPKHRIVFLANTHFEAAQIRRYGGESFVANHNDFVDPALYKVLGTPPEFDAIYNARLVEWKRHDLARNIPKLALLYGEFGPNEESYYRRLREQMPAARFLNHEFDQVGRLSKHQVVEFLNQASAGLCLSAAEGAMHSSIEYLLCGRPVVSVPNIGGRNAYLDREFCLTVPPRPAMIADAVEYLKSTATSPELVREITIASQKFAIERFICDVEELIGSVGQRSRFRELWPQRYVDKLFFQQTLQQALEELDTDW